MNIFPRIDDFRKKALRIESLSMTLKQRCADLAIRFEGYGSITQTGEDQIEFKMYADRCNTDQSKFLSATLNTASGALIPEARYFDLTATATDDQVWSSELILPRVSWGGGKAIVTGNLRNIAAEFGNPNRDSYCKLYFFDDAELWWEEFSTRKGPDFEEHSRDHTKIEAARMKMEFRKRDSHFTVAIEADEIMPDIQMRVTEALRFVLAKEVKCRVSLKGDPEKYRAEFVAGSAEAARSSLPAPIARHYDGWHDSSWVLFKKYFEFVAERGRSGSWHVVSYHLHNAREAAIALDLWTMGACVAIEGLSNLLEAPPSAPAEAELKAIREELTKAVQAKPEWQPYAERVRHSLNLLFTRSVKDRLHPLIEKGLISKAHVQAWGKLRNRHLHPKAADLANVSRDDSQNMLDGAYSVSVLLYTIVFAIIGYQGKFTDYSTRGFPTRRLPDKAWASKT